MTRSTRQQAREFLGGMGYQLVHTWNESHGNGGQDTFERSAPVEGLHACLIIVSFDSSGYCTGLQETIDRGSFLLAKQILAKVAGGEWERVGKEEVSACCTASYSRYRQVRKWHLSGDTHEWQVQVSSVAGHGDVAYWVKAAIEQPQPA